LEGEHSGVPNNWRGNMLEYQILGGENSLEYQLIGGGENNWGSWANFPKNNNQDVRMQLSHFFL